MCYVTDSLHQLGLPIPDNGDLSPHDFGFYRGGVGTFGDIS